MKVDRITKLAAGNHVSFFRAEGHGTSGTDRSMNFFTWEFFSHKPQVSIEPDDDPADAVAIVGIHGETKKQLVLVKQFRPPVRGPIIELPAGLIDKGETPGQAAARELKQETGLDLTEVQVITPRLFNSPGCTDETCVIVVVKCEGTLSTQFLEKDEDITPMLLTYEALTELMHSRPVMGAKCWLIISAILKDGKI